MGFIDKVFELQKKIVDQHAPNVTVKCESCGSSVVGKATEKTLKCEYCDSYVDNVKYQSASEIFGIKRNQDENFSNNSVFADGGFNTINRPIENFGGTVAWIEKNGLFFEGEIPGISFSRVFLCYSFEECMKILREKYYNAKSKAFFERPIQDIEKIRREHPNAKIFEIE